MMRHDSGKVLSSILKYLLKLLFVCLLLGILYYSFKDSMGDMLTELDPFDTDGGYLHLSRYPRHAALMGAACYYVKKFLDSI